jgi:hypothetical protein
MTQELYNEGLSSIDNQMQVIARNFLKQDDDGFYYIDYLSHWEVLSETHKNRIDKWIFSHIDSNDESLSEKSSWLKKKCLEAEKFYYSFKKSLNDDEYNDLLKSDFRKALTKRSEFAERYQKMKA